MTESRPTPTLLLQRIRAGDDAAREALLVELHQELHRIAGRLMRHERAGHTLQPTALVNEAWLRLFAGDGAPEVEGRDQFLFLAARAMRNVLSDHARKRKAAKRGGGRQVDGSVLDLVLQSFEEQSLDAITVDEALKELKEEDEELVRVVELRFYAGLTVPEVARLLGTSISFVERRWRLARAWLRTRIPNPDGECA